jgi:hypothetical protein
LAAGVKVWLSAISVQQLMLECGSDSPREKLLSPRITTAFIGPVMAPTLTVIWLICPGPVNISVCWGPLEYTDAQVHESAPVTAPVNGFEEHPT